MHTYHLRTWAFYYVQSAKIYPGNIFWLYICGLSSGDEQPPFPRPSSTAGSSILLAVAVSTLLMWLRESTTREEEEEEEASGSGTSEEEP